MPSLEKPELVGIAGRRNFKDIELYTVRQPPNSVQHFSINWIANFSRYFTLSVVMNCLQFPSAQEVQPRTLPVSLYPRLTRGPALMSEPRFIRCLEW